MLALFRRFLNTWAARAFFIVLIGSFGLWGISGTVRDLATDHAVATVGDRKIEPQEFQDAFRQQLAEVASKQGTAELTTAERRAVAGQTLERLVTRAALTDEAKRLGVVVPDADLTRAVFALPGFRGRTGTFDRATFNAVLRQNNLTEGRFIDLMRTDLAQEQILGPMQAAVAAPDLPTRALYTYQHETRIGAYVEFAFAAAPAPAVPTPDQLHRYYDNNAARFSAPEFRRIKVVVLSPEGIEGSVTITDADIAAYYDAHRTEFVKSERRSVEVVVSPDQVTAQAIATAWTTGADWAAIQALAAQRGASAVALSEQNQSDIPSPELAQAVFGAKLDQVSDPVQSSVGWQVFRVGRIDAGVSPTLAEATPAIRSRLARERATDVVYARTTQLEDAIAADPSMDSIPADLGVQGASGELDALGRTRDGSPAPLPGPDALRPALITAAFAQAKDDPPRLQGGPEGSQWALLVQESEPPKLKPYDDVAASVAEEWEADQRRDVQNAAAAALFAIVKAGSSLEDAATVAGLRLQQTPSVPRPNERTPSPVEPELAAALFQLRLNEPTMLEIGQAFLIVTPVSVTAPDMANDAAGVTLLRTTLTQSLAQDVASTFVQALRTRVQPTVNRTLLDSLLQ